MQKVTHIAHCDAGSITVRGLDLVGDLIGEVSFTEMIYFLVTGNQPTPAQARVLDACLVTIAEHGLTPGAIVTRLISESMPDDLQVAIAGGLMTVGRVFAGTMEGCARSLHAGVAGEEAPDAYCQRVVDEHKALKQPVPGFGHAFHKPDDPRTPKLLAIAEAEGLSGRYVAMLRCLSASIDKAAGRHVTINATGAIAALLLEIGIGADIARGIAVISRSAGLLGHILEEQQTRSARAIQAAVKQTLIYTPGPVTS